jgi:arylsulfatase A-like enzyme
VGKSPPQSRTRRGEAWTSSSTEWRKAWSATPSREVPVPHQLAVRPPLQRILRPARREEFVRIVLQQKRIQRTRRPMPLGPRLSLTGRFRLCTVLLAAFVVVPSLLWGCKRSSRKPEVRLVMVNVFCTVRKDMLSPYAPEVDYTPNLQRFADQGVVFERHVTETGQSGVAFASILTGEHAMRHQVYSHPTRLPDELQTLPEAFAAAGYETFFWERQSMGSIALNYGQGVDPDRAFGNRILTANDRRFREVLTRLQENPDYKAFILSFYSLTHTPYAKASLQSFCSEHPVDCRGINVAVSSMFEKNLRELTYNFPEATEKYDLVGDKLDALVKANELLYKSRIYYTDQVFGGLVDAIDRAGLADESIIVFTADHGETLYRETSLFKWSHSFDLAPEVMNVPWIMRGPGVERGRYTRVSSSADVFPTVAALVGLPIEPGQATLGRDLLSKSAADPKRETVVYSHTGLWPPVSPTERWWLKQPHLLRYHPRYDPDLVWVAARSNDLVVKYRADGKGGFIYEVFDVAEDPYEERNLLDRNEPAQRELIERLDRYRKQLIAAHVDPRKKGPDPNAEGPSEEFLLEQLRALGYID